MMLMALMGFTSTCARDADYFIWEPRDAGARFSMFPKASHCLISGHAHAIASKT
jgi:hypothetical protein